jgi:hypothetical protein
VRAKVSGLLCTFCVYWVSRLPYPFTEPEVKLESKIKAYFLGKGHFSEAVESATSHKDWSRSRLAGRYRLLSFC